MEDIETSYWSEEAELYGYSYRSQQSFVESMKLVADAVNREFQLGETPLPALYNSVSSVMFGQNVIILRHRADTLRLFKQPTHSFRTFQLRNGILTLFNVSVFSEETNGR